MQKTNINGSALICALFFLFMPTFGISIYTIHNFPNDMIAGSIYEAKFSFNSDLAGNYQVFMNISNAGGNETSITDCTEYQAGQFVCERRMVIGLNYVSLFLNFSPYIEPRGYPISIIFSIPYDDGITETQITSSSSTGGGGTFFFPHHETNSGKEEPKSPPSPPVKEEPIKEEPKQIPQVINETNKTINKTISIPAELINITNYTYNQTKNQTSENTIFGIEPPVIFIFAIIVLFAIIIIGWLLLKGNKPPEQSITEVML